MKKNKLKTFVLTLTVFSLLLMSVTQAQTTEKPIIVCTTNAVGSVVEALLGNSAEVLVLVQPGLCPADYEIRPGFVEAVSKATILFKQNIPGESWLDGLLEAAENKNLKLVSIPGIYNTPEGAKNYILNIGGNLSQTLDVNLDSQITQMISEVDTVSSMISSQAQKYNASNVKVICMAWLKSFIESAGFNVVATFNPPETLSAGDITSLLETAQTEGVALIVDNLQIDTEFGEGIASQVGAQHLVLTNFPGAIPNTETLAKMLRYNAEQLFNGTVMWQSAFALNVKNVELQNQLALFQISTSVLIIVVCVEALMILSQRKRKQ
jgi:ABC-type Zn uptake system ZnuABC Zn-binding protein ZnuA